MENNRILFSFGLSTVWIPHKTTLIRSLAHREDIELERSDHRNLTLYLYYRINGDEYDYVFHNKFTISEEDYINLTGKKPDFEVYSDDMTAELLNRKHSIDDSAKSARFKK
jgi:hypothetical protein